MRELDGAPTQDRTTTPRHPFQPSPARLHHSTVEATPCGDPSRDLCRRPDQASQEHINHTSTPDRARRGQHSRTDQPPTLSHPHHGACDARAWRQRTASLPTPPTSPPLPPTATSAACATGEQRRASRERGAAAESWLPIALRSLPAPQPFPAFTGTSPRPKPHYVETRVTRIGFHKKDQVVPLASTIRCPPPRPPLHQSIVALGTFGDGGWRMPDEFFSIRQS